MVRARIAEQLSLDVSVLERDEAAAERQVSVAELQASMAARDAADSNRTASPLVTADGARVIDTTGRTPDDIVAEIVEAFRAAEGAT